MKQPISQLKQFFGAFKMPTGSNFGDLIDSFFHKDGKIPASNVEGWTDDSAIPLEPGVMELPKPVPADKNKYVSVLGGATGRTYTYLGNEYPISANHQAIIFWYAADQTYRKQDEVPMPKGENGTNGQSLLELWDENFIDPETNIKGYRLSAQVRDVDGITYVSLKNVNTSALSVDADWLKTASDIELDVEGGALSYEKGKRMLNNTVPKQLPYTRVQGTIVRDNGDLVSTGEWDTTRPIDVLEGQKYIVKCFQNPFSQYQNWGRPALYDNDLNFIQFLGFNPDKDGYVTPSTFDITIPSNGKMIISTLSERTLEILDPTQDGDGIIYLTPESLDTDESALSYKKYESIISGEGLGYGYEYYKKDFEKSMYLTGPSSPQNSKSPKIPVFIGQKIEYSVGAEGLYFAIYNNSGQMVYSLEENQNKGQKKGTIVSEWNGYVAVGNNSNFEDGSDVFVKVYTNKELLSVNDIDKDAGFGTVVGNEKYKKDTNDWLVYTEFDDIYKSLLEGQLYRISTTEVALSVSNFWYHINPIKFKKGDLIRYKLTGYGAEPMYIILGSNSLSDVKFIKTFELYSNDGNNATTVEGELRVPYDCYIAFNVWNNPQITSLNYLKKGINGKKVNPQDLIEYNKPLSSNGSIFKGRKITLNRPAYMELRIRALPPLDTGEARTPTEGEVDIVIDNRVVLTAKMKWSIQGHGSARYNKKGYTFDFLNVEGKSLEIKFGDMVSIDSFHLKAYATDTTHSRDIALGRIWRDMVGNLAYPLSKVNNDVHVESINPRKAAIYTEDAKYHTDGIPSGVYVGNNFFGMYTLRLKKTRDNYALDRDNKNHIFLDSSTYTAYYAQAFRPSDWDLKSPRLTGYEEGGLINDPVVLANINRVFDFMTNLATRSSEYADFLVLPHWIDFYIHAELFQNIDINGNNNNLLTWDGVHWSPIPYDLDLTVGLDPWNSGGVVRTARPQSLFLDFDIWGTFRTVFQTQIRARYTELRQSGFLTTKNLLPYFYNQVKAVPRDAYNDDLALWGTIWTNDQPSLEQTGMYIESSIQYLDTRWLNYAIGLYNPKALNITATDATTRVPYSMNGAFIAGGLQLSRAAIANNGAIRTSTGQLKAASAVESDDLLTLGQINTADTLKPSSLNITAGPTSYIVPLANNGKFNSGVPLAQAVQNASLVQRTNTGQVKTADATVDNEAVSLGQFKGIINNALTSSETSTTLNNTYGASPIGQVVRSVTNNVEYTKISATQWKKESLAIV
ncbi:hypothetical protein [Sphingobacterium siyangense]|uniref:hypothetical protein n=1 Tax=Sphingobacterium siyangense TaxID=459529 RepID=UPI0030197676